MYLRVRGAHYCGNEKRSLPPVIIVTTMASGVGICLTLAGPPGKVMLSQDVVRTEIQSELTANTRVQVQG